MLMNPVAGQGIIEHEIDDDLVLYDPHSDSVHVLNETAAAVWWLCDGRRDGQQIAAEIGRLFGKPGPDVEAEVYGALQQLLEGGAVAASSATPVGTDLAGPERQPASSTTGDKEIGQA
jgi:hypothetical protein